jgi:superfamily II DNA or RNA helicase
MLTGQDGVYFLTGADDSDYIEHIRNKAKNRKVRILIATRKLFGEGVDIPAIDVLINAAGGKSNILFTQMFGRGLRTESQKDKLIYVDFYDYTYSHLRQHSGERIKHCKHLKQKFSIYEGGLLVHEKNHPATLF